MKKIIGGGNRTASITLDGSECEIIFGSKYNVFAVRSDSEVTVALESGKIKGDDGVMVCPAGGSIMYPHMRQLDKCYITGSGNVQIFASNEAVNPFKGWSKGGDVKPTPTDYIQDGLELMFALDGSDSDVLTNPVYVTDDTLGRIVGNIVNGQSSFYVDKNGWDCANGDGVTLQCLAKFDSLSNDANIMAVGYNYMPPTNAAIGISISNNGKLSIPIVNGIIQSGYTISTEKWYHLAMVYNNITGKISLCINGSQIYATDFYGDMSSYAMGLTIGTWVWSSQFPNPSSVNHGDFRIANCCFYSRPLKSNEIMENFEVDKKRYGILEV